MISIPRRLHAADDELFPTEAVSRNLAGRAVRGGAATMLAQALKLVLRLGSNVFLARLLTPTDFGVVAMALVFTQFAELVKDMGLSMATVQRPRVTHREVSTLFWVNVGVSALLAGLMVMMAPWVARFYGSSIVGSIVAVKSVSFVLGGLTAQHMAILRRRMLFARIGVIDAASVAVGVVVGIGSAWYGAGYWALVAMQIASALVALWMTWWGSGWWPGRPAPLGQVRELLSFGANYTGFNILTYLGRQVDNLLIGRYWGAGPLGLYDRAYALLLLPLRQINAPMTGVALPVLSRLQDDPTEYRRYYIRALNILNHITLPLIVLLGALAEPLLITVMGERWVEAAPIFQVLAVAGIGQPTLYTMTWITASLGRADKQFRWSMLTMPVFIAAFVVGLPWGPLGVAAAYAVAVNVLSIPGLAYAYRDSPVQLADAGRALWRPAATSAVALASVLVARSMLGEGALPRVELGIGLLSAGASVALLLGLWRGLREEVAAILRLRHRLVRAR